MENAKKLNDPELNDPESLKTASMIIDTFMADNRELKKYNQVLLSLNERLIGVLEAFAKKDVTVVVNSYNSGGIGRAGDVGGCHNHNRDVFTNNGNGNELNNDSNGNSQM